MADIVPFPKNYRIWPDAKNRMDRKFGRIPFFARLRFRLVEWLVRQDSIAINISVQPNGDLYTSPRYTHMRHCGFVPGCYIGPRPRSDTSQTPDDTAA